MSSCVTFVIPAYNAEHTIGRCLGSLGQQTVARWAALVVDDGSTDSTKQIVSAMAACDKRIQSLSQPNLGVSAARNRGIAAAATDLVVFLDADDTIHPDYLKRMMATLAANPQAGAVCCGSLRLSSSGRWIERSAAPRLDISPSELCRRHSPAPLHALMIRHSQLVRAGGFDPALRCYEDWDLWLRLVAAGVVFAIEPKQLALYWRSAESLTSKGPQMMRAHPVVAERARMIDVAMALRDGAAAETVAAEDMQLETVLWNCGLAIGAGEDVAAVLGAINGKLHLPVGQHAAAHALLSGLSIGCQCRRTEFIHHWHGRAPAIMAFLDQLERRIGVAGAGYALMKALERETIRGDFSGVISLSRTTGVMIGWATMRDGLQLSGAIDSVMFRLPGARAVLEVPVWGSLSGAMARRLVLLGGWARLLQALQLNAMLSELMRRVDRPVRAAVRFARRLRSRNLTTGTGERIAPAALAPGLASDRPASDRLVSDRLASIIAAARAAVEAEPVGVRVVPRRAPGHEPFELEGDALVEAWDQFFETADPWNYESPYEQLKYDRTFAMIPPGPVGRALELACAEGRFTARLAGRAGHVRALDISRTALDRAAERCRDFTNVEYVASDFFASPIEGNWDLITCAEVLYYMPDAAGLAVLAGRVFDALNPGGYFIQAHAFDVANTPGRTGFDWATPCDGEQIATAFRGVPGLRHLREMVTDLYRIDLFQKIDEPCSTAVEQVPLGSDLDYRVARFVIWNGPVSRRAEVEHERAYQVPVLMYHRVAQDGPAELAPYRVTPHNFAHQMRFLRRRGFRSTSPDEWQSAGHRGSLIGRPILLTFDDAYLDFYETAWPILRSNDFTAHIFVPTAHVGGAAVWDREFGAPAPLMDWSMIAELAADGVTLRQPFGEPLAVRLPRFRTRC